MSVLKTTTGGTISWARFTAASAIQNLLHSGTAFTYAVLTQLNSVAASGQDLLMPSPSWPWGANSQGEFAFASGGPWLILDDNSFNNSYTISPAVTTDWWIFVVTCDNVTASGTHTTFYAKNITTGSAWQSGHGSGNNTNPCTASLSDVAIGNAGASEQGANGASFALAAIWATVTLGVTTPSIPANITALAANLKTSDWYNNAAGKPDFLVECTSTTPTDIGANPSAFVSVSNLSLVTDTSGWTFDAQGSGSPAPHVFSVFLPRNTLGRGVRNRGQIARFLERMPKPAVIQHVFAAALADTSLSADALTIPNQARSLADTSLTADALPPTISLYAAFANGSLTSDSLAAIAGLVRSALADTSASTDNLTRVLRLVRSTTNTSATSESLTAQKGFSRNLANTSLASDALTRSAQSFARANTNTSVSSDSLSHVVGSPRSLANTSHTTNTLTGTAGHPRSFADTSSSGDFLTHIAGLSRPIANTSLTSDSMAASLSSSGTFSRSTADTSITTDALTGVARYPRPLADTSHSSGVLTRITGLPRVVGDSSTTNDSLTRSARSIRSSTDTSLTLDSMTGVQGGGSGPPRICLPTLASIVPYSTGASSSYSSLEAIVAYASLEAIVAYASLEAVVGGYSSFEAITGGYSSFETMTGYASHETIVTYQSLAALQTYASNAPLSACSGG